MFYTHCQNKKYHNFPSTNSDIHHLLKEQRHFQDPVGTVGQMNQKLQYLLGPKRYMNKFKM